MGTAPFPASCVMHAPPGPAGLGAGMLRGVAEEEWGAGAGPGQGGQPPPLKPC